MTALSIWNDTGSMLIWKCDAIADLLDRVTVWPDGRLEVSLKFLNELPVSAVAEQRTKTTE